LGYENVFVSKSSSPILETTKIIAQKGDDSLADALHNSLGVGEVLVESTGNSLLM